MKLFSSAQIREIDAATIANEPISSIDLVERAASACSDWIIHHYNTSATIHIFCGMGNNGADGLAVARHLAMADYKVVVCVVAHRSEACSNFTTNLDRLNDCDVELVTLADIQAFPEVDDDCIAVDAMLGIGLDKPLRGVLKNVVEEIQASYEHVIAIDVPTGLPSDFLFDKKFNIGVHADHTLTFQFPKLSFLVAESEAYTGEIHVLDIELDESAMLELSTEYHLTIDEEVESFRNRRGRFSYKGNFGHALIVAGHEGMMGAAVLASRACMRSGAGLVTAHVPQCGRDILQTAAPEVMVQVDHNSLSISGIPVSSRINAIGIGPGIGRGKTTYEAIRKLLEETEVPLVIDADAIHVISLTNSWDTVPKGSILTPHAGELSQMLNMEFSSAYQQIDEAKKWAKSHGCILVLKGAFTAVCNTDGNVYFNNSGTPGMATAGSGDVLTGIITGLLAQGLSPLKAARFGVWLHGVAGENAAEERGEHAMIASDIIEHLF